MRLLAVGGLLLSSASSAIAASCSNCSLTSQDTKVLQYAWAIQRLSNWFYETNSANQTNFSSAPNISTAYYPDNLQGIQSQNLLGAAQVESLASNLSDFQQPDCNFSMPTPSTITQYLAKSWYLETVISGAFTGLANFTQTPTVSLLLSQLAVQHATHATYIAASFLPNVFDANNISDIPVLPPDVVLSNDTHDSMLGHVLGGCVAAPEAPCG
ncbi:hypothetical protein BJX62DRAFT_239002 [Aspergillus germanicus]